MISNLVELKTTQVLTRCFESRRPIGEIVRYVELGLDNANLAPRVRADTGTREVHVALGASVDVAFKTVGSFHTQVTVIASSADNKLYGNVLRVVSAAPRMREKRPLVSGPQRTQVSLPQTNAFATQLARLKINADDVTSLIEFVDRISRSGAAVVTSKARQGVVDCVYRKPETLAKAIVDIILLTRTRTRGCSDKQVYSLLKGFRLNLSDSQINMYPEDYSASYNGKEYLGRLHVTHGHGFSPNDTASIHWAFAGVSGPVVLTRIGQHGRTGRSDR